MCTIVDTNLLAKAFCKTNLKYAHCAPIRDYLTNPKKRSKLVVGGSGYLVEFGKIRSIVPFIAEIARNGRVAYIKDAAVDSVCSQISTKVAPVCNDAHLLALALASRCESLCTEDDGLISATKLKWVLSEFGLKIKVYKPGGAKSALRQCNGNHLKHLKVQR